MYRRLSSHPPIVLTSLKRRSPTCQSIHQGSGVGVGPILSLGSQGATRIYARPRPGVRTLASMTTDQTTAIPDSKSGSATWETSRDPIGLGQDSTGTIA